MNKQNTDLVSTMASKAMLSTEVFRDTLMKTVLPANVTQEQFTAFLMVAQKYDLNPVTKEIYGFPANGGIQPIVSIDGWLKIINSNPNFDGLEFIDNLDDQGRLLSITCKIYRKDRSHHTEVTEYMSECSRNTSTWKTWPARMLRHKAAIQAGRYAFGLSGIYDQDEIERYADQHKPDKKQEIEYYPQDNFNENISKWLDVISSGKRTAEEIITTVESKGVLTDEMKATIRGDHHEAA